MTIHKKWLALFGVWVVLLSGAFPKGVGSPGATQALRLNNLLSNKAAQYALLKDELNQLQNEVYLLENNRFSQEKEVRRVLGYAGPDDLIFDFSHSIHD